MMAVVGKRGLTPGALRGVQITRAAVPAAPVVPAIDAHEGKRGPRMADRTDLRRVATVHPGVIADPRVTGKFAFKSVFLPDVLA